MYECILASVRCVTVRVAGIERSVHKSLERLCTSDRHGCKVAHKEAKVCSHVSTSSNRDLFSYLHPVIRNNRREKTRLDKLLDYTLGI